ncbi:hypothetical protein Lal_00030524 [Lupinus albus]|nr:hypothetical protein Lal_00030524 [Lupinus albus]
MLTSLFSETEAKVDSISTIGVIDLWIDLMDVAPYTHSHSRNCTFLNVLETASLSKSNEGMGGVTKMKSVRKLIRKENLDFICIKETKHERIEPKLCSPLLPGIDVDWVFQPHVGNSGGLLSIWRKNKFQLHSSHSGKGFIDICGHFWNSDKVCHIVNVYSPCNIKGKRQPWQDLDDLKKASSNNLWCLVGDFNSVKTNA